MDAEDILSILQWKKEGKWAVYFCLVLFCFVRNNLFAYTYLANIQKVSTIASERIYFY